MAIEASRSSVAQTMLNGVVLAEETALMSMAGYTSGYVTNHIVVTLKPVKYLKAPFLLAMDAAIASASFLIIDQIAKAMINKIFGADFAKHPKVVILRLAASIAATSALLVNQKMVTSSIEVIAAGISIAITVYTLFLALAEKFNLLTFGAPQAKQPDPLPYPTTFREKLSFLLAYKA